MTATLETYSMLSNLQLHVRIVSGSKWFIKTLNSGKKPRPKIYNIFQKSTFSNQPRMHVCTALSGGYTFLNVFSVSTKHLLVVCSDDCSYCRGCVGIVCSRLSATARGGWYAGEGYLASWRGMTTTAEAAAVTIVWTQIDRQ